MQKELKELFELYTVLSRNNNHKGITGEMSQCILQAESLIRKEIMEEIEKDVKSMLVNTPREVAELNRNLPNTQQEEAFNQAIGYTDAINEVKSLIQNKLTSQ